MRISLSDMFSANTLPLAFPSIVHRHTGGSVCVLHSCGTRSVAQSSRGELRAKAMPECSVCIIVHCAMHWHVSLKELDHFVQLAQTGG